MTGPSSTGSTNDRFCDPSASIASPSSPRLSIVVPCFNEADCLRYRCISGSAAQRGAVVGDDYEIVLVNDGSRDASWSIMSRLAKNDPHLVAIDLSRNHGHQLALTAGLDLCRGDLIFIIDADLQDPPEALGPMIETMEREGADVVYGVRRERAGETVFKKATAAAFYRLLKTRDRCRHSRSTPATSA